MEPWVSRLTITTCSGTFVYNSEWFVFFFFLTSHGIASPSFKLETLDADLILESSWRCEVTADCCSLYVALAAGQPAAPRKWPLGREAFRLERQLGSFAEELFV